MSNKFKIGRRAAAHTEKGQGLAEMVIIMPLLLFIFLGLIEVGWAIRGYLVLFSTNRETARFAARGEYLDFSKTDIAEVGYESVMTHTMNVLNSTNLGLNPAGENSNGGYILSHYLIDTGLPCKPGTICNCDNLQDYPYDDLVLHPGLADYSHFIFGQGVSITRSRLDPVAFAAALKAKNDELNCKILQRNLNTAPSINSLIVVEAFYEQPQLLGAPLLSNKLTDPILLYSRSIMRISPGKPQGVGCELLPIALQEDTLYNNPPQNTNLKALKIPLDDIREGAGGGNFGWLKWRDGQSVDDSIASNTNSEPYLAAAINNARLSMYDYINPNPDPPGVVDTTLNVGDWIRGYTGQVASNGVARGAMKDRIGQIVVIPVWDTASGNGQNLIYHVVGFARVKITGVNFQGNPKTISGVFMGWDETCNNLAKGVGNPIAWDGFESNNTSGGSGWASNWVFSGVTDIHSGNAFEGNRQLRIRNNSNSWARRSVNLNGASNVRLNFAWRADSFDDAGEYVEVWINDGTWYRVMTINDGQDDDQWHEASLDLSGYNMIIGFMIEFRSHLNSNNDKFYVDAIQISGGS